MDTFYFQYFNITHFMGIHASNFTVFLQLCSTFALLLAFNTHYTRECACRRCYHSPNRANSCWIYRTSALLTNFQGPRVASRYVETLINHQNLSTSDWLTSILQPHYRRCGTAFFNSFASIYKAWQWHSENIPTLMQVDDRTSAHMNEDYKMPTKLGLKMFTSTEILTMKSRWSDFVASCIRRCLL